MELMGQSVVKFFPSHLRIQVEKDRRVVLHIKDKTIVPGLYHRVDFRADARLCREVCQCQLRRSRGTGALRARESGVKSRSVLKQLRRQDKNFEIGFFKGPLHRGLTLFEPLVTL